MGATGLSAVADALADARSHLVQELTRTREGWNDQARANFDRGFVEPILNLDASSSTELREILAQLASTAAAAQA